jgi:hypothetical protein
MRQGALLTRYREIAIIYKNSEAFGGQKYARTAGKRDGI